MGYSISRRSIVRVKPYLDKMVESKETVVFPGDSKRLAYLLNQGIRSAVELGLEEFKEYAELETLYRFKLREGELIAEFRQLGFSQEERNEFAILSAREEIAKAANKHVVETALNLIDVMATMISLSEADEIRFPSAILSNDDKIRLYGWTREMENVGWAMIDQGDRGIILTKLDVPTEVLYRLPLSGEDNV